MGTLCFLNIGAQGEPHTSTISHISFPNWVKVFCNRYGVMLSGTCEFCESRCKGSPCVCTDRFAASQYGIPTVRNDLARCSQNSAFASLFIQVLTLILLTWKIWWAPSNASRWQMGFNSAFKGLRCIWNRHYTKLIFCPPCSWLVRFNLKTCHCALQAPCGTHNSPHCVVSRHTAMSTCPTEMPWFIRYWIL